MVTEITLTNKRYFADQRYWQIDATIRSDDADPIEYSHIVPGYEDKPDKEFAQYIAADLGLSSWALAGS